MTGPYGSGKSSILETLITTLPEERKPLHISLATLRVDDAAEELDKSSRSSKEREEESDKSSRSSKEREEESDKSSRSSKEKEDAEEALNRKIEYSILQQLIYHEEVNIVPNSRFRRILHIPSEKLKQYSFGVIGFILAFFIAFEPSWARIESLYSWLNWGQWNVIPDILAVIYMLAVVGLVVRKLIPNYANSKLYKLNLKEASIELNEDTSIFNQHLDEILYFFQATKYDIVIIEDLDRFCTSKIFLKLRELNFLLNESKAIGRHIVFLYAVKDDIFKDEERTKFFDYISIVIPVINPSNSKAKLKSALAGRGFSDGFPDNDLSEIAFFIQDMRILKNIANEFAQYYKLLSKKNTHLDKIKLLAMIVYKNYHPQDFALLHRRQGKVYQCLSKKADFIKLALKEVEKKKAELADLKRRKEENAHLQEIELRTLLLEKLRRQFPYNLTHISLGGERRTLSEIAADSKLFEELMGQTNVNYKQHDYYYDYSTDIDTDAPKKEINYDSRLEAIRTTPQQLIDKEQSLARQEMEIWSYTFQDLRNRLITHFMDDINANLENYEKQATGINLGVGGQIQLTGLYRMSDLDSATITTNNISNYNNYLSDEKTRLDESSHVTNVEYYMYNSANKEQLFSPAKSVFQIETTRPYFKSFGDLSTAVKLRKTTLDTEFVSKLGSNSFELEDKGITSSGDRIGVDKTHVRAMITENGEIKERNLSLDDLKASLNKPEYLNKELKIFYTYAALDTKGIDGKLPTEIITNQGAYAVPIVRTVQVLENIAKTEDRKVIRTIQYKDQDTQQLIQEAPTVTQEAIVTRTKLLDPLTNSILGYDTNNDGIVDTTDENQAWVVKEQTWGEVKSPIIENYNAPSKAKVVAVQVTPTTADVTEVIEYTQGTENIVESKTVTRTIKYVDAADKTKEVADTVKQTATITRTNVRNKVTGAITEGKWSVANWEAVDSPIVKNYDAPSKAKVDAVQVTLTTIDTTVIVEYTKFKPVPQPKPEPRPEPVPQPKPEPRPEPVPQPKPEPRPELVPQLKPEPRPEPVPQPKSEPTPELLLEHKIQKSELPKTGTGSEFEIFSAAATAILVGLGLLDKNKRNYNK